MQQHSLYLLPACPSCFCLQHAVSTTVLCVKLLLLLADFCQVTLCEDVNSTANKLILLKQALVT